jgi:hypothetical protein
VVLNSFVSSAGGLEQEQALVAEALALRRALAMGESVI